MSTGNIIHEARQRRDADDKLISEERARSMLTETSTKPPPPAIIRSFRAAVKDLTSPEEILRATRLQNNANDRLRQHHDDTVRRGHVTISSVDDHTTLVRVSLSDLELDLDKSSVTKKTMPKLLNRKLNTLFRTSSANLEVS